MNRMIPAAPTSINNRPHAQNRPDAINALLADQRDILNIYAQLMAHETPAEQLHTVEALCGAIERHLNVEEQVLYPALSHVPSLAHAANRSRSSHAMIRAHVQHIRQLIQQNENYEDELRYLMADVERYFEDEASSLLTEARQHLLPWQLQQLGEQMTDRQEGLKPARRRNTARWLRARRVSQQHPAMLMATVAGLALVTLLGVTRLRHKAQVRRLQYS